MTLLRRMDEYDLFQEELEGIDDYFKAFDVQHEQDGRISFEELSEICQESGLITDLDELHNVYMKVKWTSEEGLNKSEFLLLTGQRQELLSNE